MKVPRCLVHAFKANSAFKSNLIDLVVVASVPNVEDRGKKKIPAASSLKRHGWSSSGLTINPNELQVPHHSKDCRNISTTLRRQGPAHPRRYLNILWLAGGWVELHWRRGVTKLYVLGEWTHLCGWASAGQQLGVGDTANVGIDQSMWAELSGENFCSPLTWVFARSLHVIPHSSAQSPLSAHLKFHSAPVKSLHARSHLKEGAIPDVAPIWPVCFLFEIFYKLHLSTNDYISHAPLRSAHMPWYRSDTKKLRCQFYRYRYWYFFFESYWSLNDFVLLLLISWSRLW